MEVRRPKREEEDDSEAVKKLKEMKEVFEKADDDGSGELDIHEFCEKMGPHLGEGLTRTQIAQLFLKIDADAGGTVDWDEFTNYMFLEHSETQEGSRASENWRLFPQDFRERNEPATHHHLEVDRIHYVEPMDKYLTCGRDGTVRLWAADEVKHVRSIANGSSWVTDCVHLPRSRRLVLTSMDRAINTYDIHRDCDLIGKVFTSGEMGVPMCLSALQAETAERVVYGDSKGGVLLLCCSMRELPPRDLIYTDRHKDFIPLHSPEQGHRDCVTKLQYIQDHGMVSSSMDCTVKIYDLEGEKVVTTCDLHTKGVKDFVFCRDYAMFASCGLEREVAIWAASSGRRIGSLVGHTATVGHICIDDRLNHVFTLATDRTIKVWDLRTHKCLQTIGEDDWARKDTSAPECMLYDRNRRRLVTAARHPYIWHHKMTSLDRTGHRDPLKAVIYNHVFSVIVSVCEGGTVCVWNALTGARDSRFMRAHGDSKVTAACLDNKQRRLLTAANDGTVKMWNFNNGCMLRRFAHPLRREEITCLLFSADEKRNLDSVYAAGWNCRVFVWEDDNEDVVRDCRAFGGHREDILHMAALPAKHLLATGDYEGRINVYNMFTGERRMWLCHRADRYETCVERLQWLRAKVLPPGGAQQPAVGGSLHQQPRHMPLRPSKHQPVQSSQQQAADVRLLPKAPSPTRAAPDAAPAAAVEPEASEDPEHSVEVERELLAEMSLLGIHTHKPAPAAPAAGSKDSQQQAGGTSPSISTLTGSPHQSEPTAQLQPESSQESASTRSSSPDAATQLPSTATKPASNLLLWQLHPHNPHHSLPPSSVSLRKLPTSSYAALRQTSPARQPPTVEAKIKPAAQPLVPVLRLPSITHTTTAVTARSSADAQQQRPTPTSLALPSSVRAPFRSPPHAQISSRLSSSSLPPYTARTNSSNSSMQQRSPSSRQTLGLLAGELAAQQTARRSTTSQLPPPPLVSIPRMHVGEQDSWSPRAGEEDLGSLTARLQTYTKEANPIHDQHACHDRPKEKDSDSSEEEGDKYDSGPVAVLATARSLRAARTMKQRQLLQAQHSYANNPQPAPGALGGSSRRLHSMHSLMMHRRDADSEGDSSEDSDAELLEFAGSGAGSKAVKPGQVETFLLSFGGDGIMRVWHIQAFGGKLLATLGAANGRHDQVSAVCCDPEWRHVFIGDTAGHVVIWDVSAGLDVSSPEGCAASFKLRSQFRTLDAGVTTLDVVLGRELLIVGGRDSNVSIWTYEGGLVGILGEHSWDLEDPSTWQDPHALKKRVPKNEMEELYSAYASSAPESRKRAVLEDEDEDSHDPLMTRFRNWKKMVKDASLLYPGLAAYTALTLHQMQEVPKSKLESGGKGEKAKHAKILKKLLLQKEQSHRQHRLRQHRQSDPSESQQHETLQPD